MHRLICILLSAAALRHRAELEFLAEARPTNEPTKIEDSSTILCRGDQVFINVAAHVSYGIWTISRNQLRSGEKISRAKDDNRADERRHACKGDGWPVRAIITDHRASYRGSSQSCDTVDTQRHTQI
jgi:hypothetical protein